MTFPQVQYFSACFSLLKPEGKVSEATNLGKKKQIFFLSLTFLLYQNLVKVAHVDPLFLFIHYKNREQLDFVLFHYFIVALV